MDQHFLDDTTGPSLNTKLPGPKASDVINRDLKFLSSACSRPYPFVMSHGRGSIVYDVDGNRFLDLMAGIAVSAAGHNHPHVIDAIQKQTSQFLHLCGPVFHYDIQVQLAEKLSRLAPVAKPSGVFRDKTPKVFFSNSGAEAVEGALKAARYFTKRPAYISFIGAFHGRSYGALSMNASKVVQRGGFDPLLPGVYFAYYPTPYVCPHDKSVPHTTEQCLDYIENTLFKKLVDPEQVAAFILEPVQGEGGYVVPPTAFMKALRKLADKYGIILILDEVQSGAGRTGKFYATEHFDIKADIITSAKGLGGGMPLGAFIGRSDVMSWPASAHGSTYAGNPVACAASLAIIELLEDHLMDHTAKVGKYLMDQLKDFVTDYSFVGDVRGLGLMVAMEIVKDKDTGVQPDGKTRDKIISKAFEHGLLMLPCGTNTVRFCPPLVISKAQIDLALETLRKVLKSI